MHVAISWSQYIFYSPIGEYKSISLYAFTPALFYLIALDGSQYQTKSYLLILCRQMEKLEFKQEVQK